MAGFSESYQKIISDFKKSSMDFFNGLSDSPMCMIYSILGNDEKAEHRLHSILKHQKDNKGPDGLLQIDDYQTGDIVALPLSLALMPVAYCAKTYREFKQFKRLLKDQPNLLDSLDQKPEIIVYRFDEKP